jgi:hypothetical protein
VRSAAVPSVPTKLCAATLKNTKPTPISGAEMNSAGSVCHIAGMISPAPKVMVPPSIGQREP